MVIQGSKKLRGTADSSVEKKKANNDILEIKEEYETILSNKEEYIQELKDVCMKLDLKVEEIQAEFQSKMKEAIDPKEMQISNDKLAEEEKANSRLKEKVKQMEEKFKKDKEVLEKK